MTDETTVSDATAPGTAVALTENETAAEAATRRDKAREAAGKAAGQAGDKLRMLASDGKSRASGALGEFAKMIDDAAGQVDDKLGAQFGGYARQASGAVGNFASTLEQKDVDELIDDARAFVQKSPAVAIGIAAALGFVVARVLRSGVDSARD